MSAGQPQILIRRSHPDFWWYENGLESVSLMVMIYDGYGYNGYIVMDINI